MESQASISAPMLMPLRVVRDTRGALVAVDWSDLGFDVERVYFLFDVQAGAERGGHAHKALVQLLLVPTGSFTVITDDGLGAKQEFEMRSPPVGLLLPPGTWRELRNFSSGAVCLVLASARYAEEDYIRDYSEFTDWKRQYGPIS